MLQRRLRAGGGRIQLIKSATSTAVGGTIVVPTGCKAGDLFVLFNLSISSTATPPTTVLASGFTEIANGTFVGSSSGRGYRGILSLQVAGSDISGTTLTCMNGGNSDTMVLGVYRGRKAFATGAAFDINNDLQTGDPAAQVINVSGQTCPLIVFAAGLSLSFAQATSTVTTGGVALKALPFDGGATDITVDASASGDGAVLQSCYIQLTY